MNKLPCNLKQWHSFELLAAKMFLGTFSWKCEVDGVLYLRWYVVTKTVACSVSLGNKFLGSRSSLLWTPMLAISISLWVCDFLSTFRPWGHKDFHLISLFLPMQLSCVYIFYTKLFLLVYLVLSYLSLVLVNLFFLNWAWGLKDFILISCIGDILHT